MLIISGILLAQKPTFVSAKVTQATVYFNSAELTQTVQVPLKKGTNEIVIKNVADYLNENSLRIGAPAHVSILSSQFTKNYISEYELDETSPATKKVRDSIKLVQQEILKVQTERNSNQKTIELLDKNQQVSGSNSGLNVAELMKMVEYYRTKRNELNLIVNQLNEKEVNLNTKLTKLNARLQINSSQDEKVSQGKLILQIMSETAGNVNLDINYLTQGASWNPFYDLRVQSVKSPINMMYKAQVVQNTGIDWKQVKLTLSSGNPNQNNQAPILNSWYLNFSHPQYMQAPNLNLKSNYISGSTSEVAYEKIADSSMSNYTTVIENQLNIAFEIDVLYDILSNGKQHSISMKEVKLPASYKYYSVPKLDKEAYLLAEITDYAKYNMLPGEANIIFEGMYVGKTVINPNQTVDTLNLSMGKDKRISIKREKVVDKSSTKFLSNYKEQIFTFDITIRNNKSEPIQIMVKDQIPLSSDKEIEIQLLESSKGKLNPEIGVLTWELNLKPNETKVLRMSYKVRYPKDKFVANL